MMDTSDAFEIRNFRLLPLKNGKMLGLSQTRHPLQPQATQDLIEFEGEMFQRSEDFGNVYVGEAVRSMAQIRYRPTQNQLLEYINIDIMISGEDQPKKAIKVQGIREENVRAGQEFKLKFACNFEAEKSYLFTFAIKYKLRPFIQNAQNGPIIPENQKIKQYRIQPKLPFLVDKQILVLCLPYYLEYSLQTKMTSELEFKAISFLPEDLFESTKITQNDDGSVVLKPEEKEKVIFKVDLKPGKEEAYRQIVAGGSQKIGIGSLFLEWGISGVFMSKLEEAQVQAYDIDLQLVNQPIFAVRKITKCTLRITNILKNIRNAKVILRDIEMDGVKIIGFENSIVDFTLNPSRSFDLVVHVMPITLGLQKLKGINFYDEEKKRYCTLFKIPSLLVQAKEDPLQFNPHSNSIRENQQYQEEDQDVLDFFGSAEVNKDQAPNVQPSASTAVPLNQKLLDDDDDDQANLEDDGVDDFFAKAGEKVNTSNKQEDPSVFEGDLLDIGLQQGNSSGNLSGNNSGSHNMNNNRPPQPEFI